MSRSHDGLGVIELAIVGQKVAAGPPEPVRPEERVAGEAITFRDCSRDLGACYVSQSHAANARRSRSIAEQPSRPGPFGQECS